MTSTKCKLPIESYAFNVIQTMMGSRQRGIGQIVSRAFNDLKSHLEHHPDWRRVRDDMGLKTYAEWEAIHAAKCQAEREAAQAAEHQAKLAEREAAQKAKLAAQAKARAALRLEKADIKRERTAEYQEARKKYVVAAAPLRWDLATLDRLRCELIRADCKHHRFHFVPRPKGWPDGVTSAKALLAEADRALSARTADADAVNAALDSVKALRADLCEYVDALFAGGMPDDDPYEIYKTLRENCWSGGSRPRHPDDDE